MIISDDQLVMIASRVGLRRHLNFTPWSIGMNIILDGVEINDCEDMDDAYLYNLNGEAIIVSTLDWDMENSCPVEEPLHDDKIQALLDIVEKMSESLLR